MNEYYWDIKAISDEEFERWYRQMQPSRQEKCKRLKKETAQKQCIATDHVVRTVLSKHLHRPAEEITISVSESGKPYIEGNPMHFSVSHSENMIACAISEFPVGIDIERIRPIPTTAQERICTKTELEYLFSAKDEGERNLRFLHLWTRKEAVFKTDGRLPRRDKEIDTLTLSAGWTVETRMEGNFIISVAIRQNF